MSVSMNESMKSQNRNVATAFAPATVANVGIGFDILGFSFGQIGDKVRVEKNLDRSVNILNISGLNGLPLDPTSNTATAGLLKLIEDKKLKFGFNVEIEKGIPIGSGLGGSAASAVAAIKAANELLDQKLSKEEMVKYAMEGEYVASGSRHADNVAPAIYGGLILIKSISPIEIVEIPWPKNLMVVLIHPDLKVETKSARAVLSPHISLKNLVTQSANLASFLAGCFKNDLSLLKNSVNDVIVEPQRAHLIKGFQEVKQAALSAGAIGVSISGSGPSIFAFACELESANKISRAMEESFLREGIKSQSWISEGTQPGAVIL